MLKKLTASFGKLKGQTLELHEGLNVICAPNEAGKSTWTEFLLAMFYGIDTGQRRRQGEPLPVKERCRPWDGGLMEGSIQLQWQGRDLTLERTGSARTPMSTFRAFDTNSGMEVPELDAKSCGQTLLGVERGVYERSAFIRQRGIALSSDLSLEQRLGALVSTGSEDYAYSALERKLRDMKNRCRHNKTGLIPAAEMELAAVTQRLQEIHVVQEELARLQSERKELEQRQKELSRATAVLKAQQAKARLAQLDEAAAACAAAVQRTKDLQAQCRALPQPDDLDRLQASLTALEGTMQAAKMDAAFVACDMPRPVPPTVFSGLTPEMAAQKAAQDTEEYTRLTATIASVPLALLALGLVLLVGGLLLAWQVQRYLGLSLSALGLVLTVFWFVLRQKRQAKHIENQHRAQLILTGYGVAKPEDMAALAASYQQQSAIYAEALAQTQAQKTNCEQQLAALERQQSLLFGKVSAFAEGADSFAACRAAIDCANAVYTTLNNARREEAAATAQLEALRRLAGQMESSEQLTETLYNEIELDPEALRRQTERCSAQLLAVRSRMDEARGKLAALGEPLALTAQKEQLTERLSELNRKNAGLALALEVLEESNRELQSRFSPMVCSRAGEYLAQLTGGQYDKLLLDSHLSVTVQSVGGAVMRPTLALSCGTADQIYLAVRLAICDLLMPEAPLVLDDALVAFDDERAGYAMKLLRQQAQRRQVILFTCQSRELTL